MLILLVGAAHTVVAGAVASRHATVVAHSVGGIGADDTTGAATTGIPAGSPTTAGT
jgi:hypothetical protein